MSVHSQQDSASLEKAINKAKHEFRWKAIWVIVLAVSIVFLICVCVFYSNIFAIITGAVGAATAVIGLIRTLKPSSKEERD